MFLTAFPLKTESNKSSPCEKFKLISNEHAIPSKLNWENKHWISETRDVVKKQANKRINKLLNWIEALLIKSENPLQEFWQIFLCYSLFAVFKLSQKYRFIICINICKLRIQFGTGRKDNNSYVYHQKKCIKVNVSLIWLFWYRKQPKATRSPAIWSVWNYL